MLAMETETETVTDTKTDVNIKRPPMYEVVIFNDDRTTVEFVISLLMKVFYKSYKEAVALTLSVHELGSAVVDVYPKEIAEEKVKQAIRIARSKNYPLHLEARPVE